jgi:hypothetical protein
LTQLRSIQRSGGTPTDITFSAASRVVLSLLQKLNAKAGTCTVRCGRQSGGLVGEQAMIVFTRQAIPVAGKLSESTNFAKERAAAINKLYGVEVDVFTCLGGNAGQFNMVSRHENLAEFEELRRKIIADSGAGKLPTPGQGMLVDGSTMDRLWLKL